jgi:hypothetical protein
VRVQAATFFYSKSGSLVESFQIIDCYRMARFYHVSPTVFLDMGLTEFAVHLRWTSKLSQIMNAESNPDA